MTYQPTATRDEFGKRWPLPPVFPEFAATTIDDDHQQEDQAMIASTSARKCSSCGKKIVEHPWQRSNKKFCSTACRQKAYRERIKSDLKMYRALAKTGKANPTAARGMILTALSTPHSTKTITSNPRGKRRKRGSPRSMFGKPVASRSKRRYAASR